MNTLTKSVWTVIAAIVVATLSFSAIADTPFVFERAYVDREEPEAEFQARVATLEKALEGYSKQEPAGALAIAIGESKLAKYVLHDCSYKPKDATGHCDHGNARTYWQLWYVACNELRGVPTGSDESVKTGAFCAIRRWKQALATCKSNVEQSFSQYAGRHCSQTTKSTAFKYEVYKKLMR